MLKKAGIVLAVLATIGLVGCRQENKADMSTPTNTVKKDETPSDKPQNEPEEEKQYQNGTFKEVSVGVVGDHVIVTGKVRVFEGVFQYAIMNGDNIIKQDKYQTAGAPAWGDFTISFQKDLAINEGTRFQLFVYSAKDGSKINILEIPINSIK